MKNNALVSALLLCAFALAALPAFAQEATDGSAEKKEACYASINGIVGACETQAAGAAEDEWKAAELNQCLNPGDKVRTLGDGKVALKYGEALQMRVNASSTFVIVKQEGSEQPDEIDLSAGELYAELDKEKDPESNFKVVTPSGVMSVRGTKFNIAISEDGKTKVNVLEGVLSVLNDLGEVLAEAGKFTEILKGELPLDPADFNIEDFTKSLDAWKDAISIGKILEGVKDEVNKKVEEVKDQVPTPKNIKKKLGF